MRVVGLVLTYKIYKILKRVKIFKMSASLSLIQWYD